MDSYKSLAGYIKSTIPELANEPDRDVAQFAVDTYPDQFKKENFDWSDPIEMKPVEVTPEPSFGTKMGRAATSAAYGLESAVAAAPGLAIDALAQVPNFINTGINAATEKVFGKKYLKQDYKAPVEAYDIAGTIAKKTGTEDTFLAKSLSSEQLKQQQRNYAESQKMAEPGKGLTGSLIEKIKRGDIKDAAEYLAVTTVEQAPQNILAAVLSVATKNPKVGMAILGGSSASSAMQESIEKEKAGEAPTDRTMATLNAINTGLWEYGGELAGTAKILEPIRNEFLKIAKKEGVQKAQKKATNYATTLLSNIFKEAKSEAVTSAGQQLGEMFTGTKDITLQEFANNLVDAGVMGAVASGPLVALSSAAEVRQRRQAPTVTPVTPQTTPLITSPATLETPLTHRQIIELFARPTSQAPLTIDEYYKIPKSERPNNFQRLSEQDQQNVILQYREEADAEGAGAEPKEEGGEKGVIEGEGERLRLRDIEKNRMDSQAGGAEAGIEVVAPFPQKVIKGMAERLAAVGTSQAKEDVLKNMTEEESRAVYNRVRSKLPEIDISKITTDEIEEALGYGREGKLIGGRKYPSPLPKERSTPLILNKNEELEKRGPEIASKVEGVTFKAVQEGIKTATKTQPPLMLFDDEYTGSTISIKPEETEVDLKKKIEELRGKDFEATAKGIAKQADLKYIGKKAVVGENKKTDMVYLFETPNKTKVTIQKGDTVESVKSFIQRKEPTHEEKGRQGQTLLSEQIKPVVTPEQTAPPVKQKTLPPKEVTNEPTRLEAQPKRTRQKQQREQAAVKRTAPDENYGPDYWKAEHAHAHNVNAYNALRFGWKDRTGTERPGSQQGWIDDYNLITDSRLPGGSSNPKLSQNAKDYLQNIVDNINENPDYVQELEKMGIKKPEHIDDVKEILQGSMGASEFTKFHHEYEKKLKGKEYVTEGLNKALEVFNDDPKKLTPDQVKTLEDHFQAPLNEVIANYEEEEGPVEEPAKKEAKKEPTKKELKPEDVKQQDLFGKEKSAKELEAEEKKRVEKQEVEKKIAEKKGGEADLTNLPMFENQEIEGSPQTLDLFGERKKEEKKAEEKKPKLSKKEQAKQLFLKKQEERASKPTAEDLIGIEKEKQAEALKRAQEALNKLGKSFGERDPNTLYSIGTEQGELAFEAISALIEAGYREFKVIAIKVNEMAKEYMKIKDFRNAIEDAFDAYSEVDEKIEKRKLSIDDIIKESEVGQKKEIKNVKEELIGSLVKRFESGEPIKNTRELLNYSDKAYGGTVAEGKYGIRDAYDALEAAFNMYLENHGRSPDAKNTIKLYNEEMKLLPTQTVRTEAQVELQQFSTPPSEAFLVAKLAGIREGMLALEPSAGDGSIAVQARIEGAKVLVNEIDKGRQENLKVLGFEPTGVDAEYLNSTLPEEIQPDVVVMNPPFSATGGRIKGHNTSFGAEHVHQALLRLKPGGRLVAIVGNGMAFGKPKMSLWWYKIFKGYNVRANIGISGTEYTKYGTGFDNNIIVIDKTGPTSFTGNLPDNAITGEGLTVEQAYDKLKSLTEEDVYGNIQKANAGKGQTVASKGEQKLGGEKPAVGDDNNIPVGRGRGATSATRSRANRKSVADMDKLRDRLPGSAGGGGLSAPNGSGKAVTDTIGKQESGVGEKDDRSAGQPRGELQRSEPVKPIQEESGGVYAKYQVSKATYKGAKEHPAKVSESVAMASVQPPDVTYKLHLPQSLIESGAISDVQLEAITYAAQAHEQRLPNGQRKEFLLGDGTGMGKARTLIGIIQENWLQGRKKTVYVTKTADLANQLKADMQAMGVKIPVIEQGKYKQGEPIDSPEGILFTTYSTAGGEFKTSKKRYNQILNWFGKDNDGVFIFDESHLMKNVSESKFEFGGEAKSLQEGSDRGQMGVSFKKDLSNARFVNASATAATTPVNLAYLSRLGLWGEGTPFPDFMSFLNVMKDGGTGAMELLSRDLKSNGLYLSRSISFDGVEYETVTHDLSESEKNTYNNMADFWAMMLVKIEEAAANAHMKGEKQKIMKQFYSAQQRFFLQLMMSFQAESMIKDADSQLESGNSVVISLYNTNESQTDRKVNEAIANGDDIDAIEFSPKDSMKTMLENNFPIIQYEEYTDENGTKGTRQVKDSAGNPLINKENKDTQMDLIEKIADLRIPENPIDRIVNHFGVDNIAEITGRKNRLIINESGHREYKPRGSKDVPQKKINQHEREAFMSGKKRVAIISGAAATGFDLHSSLRSKNQERRVLYAMQLSWSADEQMQAFGRVHRTMQKWEPIIKLMKTNIASQMRLVNTIQSRLASLGAMTKGGREALSGGIFTTEDIADEYGKAALATIYKNAKNSTLKRMNVLDKEGGVKQGATNNVEGFLNRIMVLLVEDQNQIFESFYKEFQDNVESAKNKGTYDEGIQKIKGENVRLIKEEVLNKDEVTNVETKLVTIESDVSVKKLTYDDFGEKGLIPVINEKSGNGYLLRKTGEGEYFIYGPRGFRKSIDTNEFYQKYKRAEEQEVRKLWTEAYNKIPEKETVKTVLVTGSVFPVYRKLFAEKDHSSKKVKRAVFENGESVIGIEINQSTIPKVKQNFGIGSDLYNLTGKEILDLINADSIIQLDNGWIISKRRVMGEYRIEVDPSSNMPSKAEIEKSGIFTEIIQSTRRYFIPAGKAEESLDSILKYHKAARDMTAKADIKFAKRKTSEPRQEIPLMQKSGKEKEVISAIYEAYGKKPNYSVLNFTTGGKAQEEIKGIFEELTGDPIQFIETDSNALRADRIDQFDGFRHNDTVYLNISGSPQRPLLWTAFHEWYHGLTDNERKFIEEAAKATDAGWKKIAQNRQEFFADIAGEIMSRPETLEYMAKNNPVRLKKIVQKLIDTINSLVEKFRKLVTGEKATYDKYITGAEEMRDRLIEVLNNRRLGKDMGKGVSEAVFSEKEKADPFFSPLLKAVQSLKQNKGTGEQFFNMLTKAPGVKEAEEYIKENTGPDKIGTQQSIPITPEMANSVLYEGQPMFAKREYIEQEGYATGQAERLNKLESVYQEIESMKKPTLIEKVLNRRKSFRETHDHIAAELLVPISTRLRRIGQEFKDEIRKLEFKIKNQEHKDIKTILPFLEATKKMTFVDYESLDSALVNADKEKVSEIVTKYGLEEKFQAARTVLDAIHKRAKAVGFQIGYLENYWPRRTLDSTGLLNALRDTPDWDIISKETQETEDSIGRILTDEEKCKIANSIIGSPDLGIKAPGQLKERTIDVVDNNLKKFYDDSNSAIVHYIHEMNQNIEFKRLLGKTRPTKTEGDKIVDINRGIGEYVLKARNEGRLNPEKQDELIGLLKSRFNYRPSGGITQTIKDLGYLTSMGSGFSSFITQIGDLAWAFYVAPLQSPRALAKAFTGAFNEKLGSEIKKEDLGLDRIAEEFRTSKGLLGRVINKVFDITLLSKMDNIGKETLINALNAKYRAQAKSGSSGFKNEMKRIFGEHSDKVINDFKEGKITDSVKYVLFSRVLDFQPVALSEMPKAYLDSPKGRLFYMLKTFTIKQLDVFRSECLHVIRMGVKNKDFKMVAEGVGKLMYLTILFSLANAGADEIKDWIFGRKTTLADKVADNIARLFALSRYFSWTVRREGPGSALVKLISPPLEIIEAPAADVFNAFKKDGKPFMVKLKNAESWKLVPFVGKHWYWKIGKGAEIAERQRLLNKYPKEFQEISTLLNSKRGLNKTAEQAAKDKARAVDKITSWSKDKQEQFRKFKDESKEYNYKQIEEMNEQEIKGEKEE